MAGNKTWVSTPGVLEVQAISPQVSSSRTVRTHLQGDIGPGQGPGFSVAPPCQPDKSDCGPSIAATTWLGSAARLTSVGYDFVVSIWRL